MMTVVLLLIHFLSAGTLAYAAFCRLAMTDSQTAFSIRLGIWLIGSVAAAAVVAPIYGWTPDIFHVGIFCAVAIMQVVTRRVWDQGVPQQFRRGYRSGKHR